MRQRGSFGKPFLVLFAGPSPRKVDPEKPIKSIGVLRHYRRVTLWGNSRLPVRALVCAEALSTRERWASVGTYSAGILRFQSLIQGTRARYTENASSKSARESRWPFDDRIEQYRAGSR
jgi:hypothetical protein